MRKVKITFLEEAEGVQSWMRLACSAIVLQCLFIINYQMVMRPDHSFDLASVLSLLTIALTGKVMQKAKEIPEIKA